MTAIFPAQRPLAAAVRRVSIQLRDYQQRLKDDVTNAWSAGHSNVLAVLPVGGGKTVIFSNIIADEQGASCAIAHRQELVAQMSLALARQGVRHNIIAPTPVVKAIVRLHLREIGYSFFDSGNRVAVAGVDTLIRRTQQLKAWADTVRLWVQDEGHHVLRKNKWGKAAAMFPHARGLLVTATPDRADGKGLGREFDGVADIIVEGPKLRDLIWLGWLTDYDIYAPPPSLQMSAEDVGASGDYTQKKLAVASKKSRVVGDVVEHYRRYAWGKRGITFTTDRETSNRIAQAFTDAGVPARAVDGDSADDFRTQSVDMLRAGDLLNLVNVDLFGEGFDLPAVQVVNDARPTESFARFVQAVGRILRPEYAPDYPLDTPEQRRAAIAAGPKPRAVYIDHVGNVVRHAVARQCEHTGETVIDVCYREWSLAGREKRGKGRADDVMALTRCLNTQCLKPYEAVKPRCPYCGYAPEPANRSGPEYVDGDLTALDPSALKQITAAIAKVDGAVPVPPGTPHHVMHSIRKNHVERQKAQKELRDAMAWWAGYELSKGRDYPERLRRFNRTFGIDAGNAQTLGAREARDLANTIMLEIAKNEYA